MKARLLFAAVILGALLFALLMALQGVSQAIRALDMLGKHAAR